MRRQLANMQLIALVAVSNDGNFHFVGELCHQVPVLKRHTLLNVQ